MTHKSKDLQVTTPDECEIVHERVFDAPRRLVFAALTRPELLARWYGPPGWSLVACEIDFRVGGAWRIVTRKPNGREIVQQGVFTDIRAPERFAKTEHWIDWDVGEVVVTSVLTEHQDQTTLIVTTRFPSQEVRDQLLEAGANRDARVHYEQLEAFLGTALAEQLGIDP